MIPRVICIGEALVEMVKVELDSPHEALGHYAGPYPSGAPAIFASTAGRLARAHGFSAGFIGTVGSDPFGEAFIDRLAGDGVDTRYVRRSHDNATGVAFVQLNRDGSRSFVFSKGAAVEVDARDWDEAYFGDVGGIHISGSSLSMDARLREACLRALDLAVSRNPACLVTFDPNFRIEMADPKRTLEWSGPVLARTTHLLPSGGELEFLMQTDRLEDACRAAFAQSQRLRAIVAKRGSLGCTVFERSAPTVGKQVSSYPADERFPTGAGDNFGAALLVGLLGGLSLGDAARHACAAGSLAVEEPGLMKAFTWKDVQARMGVGR
jgi:fructokinase